MSHCRQLVLLTSEFPYGTVAEPFLETEIQVLAERFDRIYVLPSHNGGPPRRLPDNADLVRMDWLKEPTTRQKISVLLSQPAARVVATTAKSGAPLRPYTRASKFYADNLARSLLKLQSLVRFAEKHRLHQATFYDYWFENTTLAIALLRRSGQIATAVCRAHGFDIYDERWPTGLVPFREVKALGLDAVFAVSDFGRRYLERRVPTLRGKASVAYLGVPDPGCPEPAGGGGTPIVMTCARLVAGKNVHLVPEVLALLGRPVHWLHVGDGPERERVLDALTRLNGQVTWELLGQISNSDLRGLYVSRHIAVFLSLSTSEGAPVSMMEAQSYGVPVVARAVGGIPEIVNEQTGVLVPATAPPVEVATAVAEALEPGRFDPTGVHSFFREHFDAATNYNRFADALVAIAEG